MNPNCNARCYEKTSLMTQGSLYKIRGEGPGAVRACSPSYTRNIGT